VPPEEGEEQAEGREHTDRIITGKLPPFRLFKYRGKPPLSSEEVIEMKMDIAKLTLNEVEALDEKLSMNNVSTVIERTGDRLVLDVG
jgi:hypothetical protein